MFTQGLRPWAEISRPFGAVLGTVHSSSSSTVHR
jgi:hypothetical protein